MRLRTSLDQPHRETMPATIENPEIADLLAQVAALRRDARELTAGLSPAQLNWRPSPKRWSIAQCLEHLTRTVMLYPERVEAMLVEAKQRAARREKPYRESAFSRWFVRSMNPPVKLRVPTTKQVNPPPDLDAERVKREFDAAHERLTSWIAAADGLSLRHARTTSPFNRMFRFTLGQVFALNTAHGRRHLWQARQVRAQPSFPQS
jgi:hypothetical protein